MLLNDEIAHFLRASEVAEYMDSVGGYCRVIGSDERFQYCSMREHSSIESSKNRENATRKRFLAYLACVRDLFTRMKAEVLVKKSLRQVAINCERKGQECFGAYELDPRSPFLSSLTRR